MIRLTESKFRHVKLLTVILGWMCSLSSMSLANVVLEFGELQSGSVVPTSVVSLLVPQTIAIGVFATAGQPNQSIVSFDLPFTLSTTSLAELVGAQDSILPDEGNFGFTDTLAPNGIDLVVFDDVPFEDHVDLPEGVPTKLFDLLVSVSANMEGNLSITMPFANGTINTLDIRTETNALLTVPSASREGSLASKVTAVPEPTPPMLMLLLMCVCGWWRRRSQLSS